MRRKTLAWALFFYLLWGQLTSSDGLSPPENFTLTIEDFIAVVYWSPAARNQTDTLYTIEMKNLGESWKEVDGCRGIESTSCTLPLTFEDIHGHYFIRVKSMRRNETSKWSDTLQVQPYSHSKVSPPIVTLSLQHREVKVKLEHPISSQWGNAEYTVQLYERSTPWAIQRKILMNISDPVICSFEGLIPGYHYCVKAKVLAYSESPQSQEACIFLPSRNGTAIWLPVSFVSCFLLIVFFLVVSLYMMVQCYLKPKPSNLQTPKTLEILTEGPGRRSRLRDVVWSPKRAPISSLSLSDSDALLCSSLRLDSGYEQGFLSTSSMSNSTVGDQDYSKRCSLFYRLERDGEESLGEVLECAESLPPCPLSGIDEEEWSWGQAPDLESGPEQQQPDITSLDSPGVPLCTLSLAYNLEEEAQPDSTCRDYSDSTCLHNAVDNAENSVLYHGCTDEPLSPGYQARLGVLATKLCRESIPCPRFVHILPSGYESRPDPCAY
ncbi:cytokine receptor family member B12 [Amia ocellicauda]|uniref:cytokine receptor family member B12 n=1 Tax=Amia ocellicauda TaxID=2972642 RepID=UPI003463E56F